MKNAVILASHMHSGSTSLLTVLAENPRIQSYCLGVTYDHPTSLINLTEMPHKCSHRGATYVDEVLYNHLITSKAVLNSCRFIYVVREPLPVLNSIVSGKHLEPGPACRYYCYRLQRLCEMARRTPGSLLLTWDDMSTGRCYPLLQEYLFLKEPLVHNKNLFQDMLCSRNILDQKQLDQAQRSYERHLYYLRQLPLLTL